MKYSIPGLGGRLRRARNGTGLSQENVAAQLGISWMTVLRWEKSLRGISEENLDQLCTLYDRPLHWFLTLEEGDLEVENGPAAEDVPSNPTVAARLSGTIIGAPAEVRPMIEKVVEDLLDGLKRVR